MTAMLAEEPTMTATPKAPREYCANATMECALRVIAKEIEGIDALRGVINDAFVAAVEAIVMCEGKLVACGVGKSGHIARKISATLASLGTPSVYIHPTEASHGDMGVIGQKDMVLLLSNSGETRELEDVIAYCKRFAVPIVGVVRRAGSMLAQAADYSFILPEIAEVTPVNAPTTSSTMMLVWGDALAVALMERRGFDKTAYGVLHPGGKIGSRLKKVDALMTSKEDMPLVHKDDLMSAVLIEMTKKSLGCAVVLDDNEQMAGIITDGDLRRHMSDDLVTRRAHDVMFCNFKYVTPDALAAEALHIMSERKITNLPVSHDGKTPQGMIHLQMLLAAGVY